MWRVQVMARAQRESGTEQVLEDWGEVRTTNPGVAGFHPCTVWHILEASYVLCAAQGPGSRDINSAWHWPDGFTVGYNPTFSSLNLTPGLSRFPLPFSLKIQCSQKRGSWLLGKKNKAEFPVIYKSHQPLWRHRNERFIAQIDNLLFC